MYLFIYLLSILGGIVRRHFGFHRDSQEHQTKWLMFKQGQKNNMKKQYWEKKVKHLLITS